MLVAPDRYCSAAASAFTATQRAMTSCACVRADAAAAIWETFKTGEEPKGVPSR